MPRWSMTITADQLRRGFRECESPTPTARSRTSQNTSDQHRAGGDPDRRAVPAMECASRSPSNSSRVRTIAAFRLGDNLSMQLPSSLAYVLQVEKDGDPVGSPCSRRTSPVAMMQPVAVGRPTGAIPASRGRCIAGCRGVRLQVTSSPMTCGFTAVLGRLPCGLHRADAAGGPLPGAHNFSRGGSAVSTSEPRRSPCHRGARRQHRHPRGTQGCGMPRPPADGRGAPGCGSTATSTRPTSWSTTTAGSAADHRLRHLGYRRPCLRSS